VKSQLHSFSQLPPDQLARVDACCRLFENAWRAEQRPRLEDFLSDTEAPEHQVLLQELILIDAEYRLQAGEAPRVADYVVRFPGLEPGWLEAHLSEQTETPVEPMAAASTLVFGPPAETDGALVAGRFKLLERIGEGGMGTVWVAEQLEPVRRKVAVKLIKEGMDSKSVLARFDAERQALALMDHPNIAKVLDGGTTASGRPFFVMEYVKGVPFTKYCDNSCLTVAQRLELMVPVCQAVEHAHQKGIIHRDLKPSNILVCLYDGKPVPKVIDFGLAKAMHEPLTEQTLHTAHGFMMGTPLYMSPEQAEFNNLDVDTRTDIYALGVILYELLTGTTPLERQRLRDASWDEMMRLIKEVEPPTPSARLSGSADLASVAAQRRTEPGKLTRLVRGEPDWIVMKALAKERARRYETARDLARDLQRYLADEPVEASPPSARYRLGKFARKHRAALAMAATVALLLLAGIAASTWQAVRATVAEDDAVTQTGIAKESERKAKQSEGKAKESEQKAKENEERALQIAEELKYNLALDQILLAQAAFDGGNLALARERLERVPAQLRRWEWYYLQRQYHPGIFTLYGHAHRVKSVAYSFDGSRLATGSDDGTARIWDARTGLLLLELRGHLKPKVAVHSPQVTSVAFSPDGTRLATASTDKTTKIWDARTGELVRDIIGHKDQVLCVAFSPDGTRLVTSSADETTQVWDAHTGMALFELKGHAKAKSAVVATPVGPVQAMTFPVLTIAFSRDGKFLVTGSWDKTAKVWDAQTGKHLLDFKGHTGPVWSVAFSPDGASLVTGSADGSAKIWDARTAKPVRDLLGHNDTVRSAAFSLDGTHLVTGGEDGTAKTWDARTGTLLFSFKGHTAAVTSVAFSPDGKRVVTASDDATATVWDAGTGTPRVEFKAHAGSVKGVDFSRDGRRLLTGGDDGTPKVWDAQGKLLLTLKAHSPPKLWDPRTKKPVFEYKGRPAEVTCVAYSPDGSRFATGGADASVNIRDADSGALLRELKLPHIVSSLAFDAGGTRIAAGSYDEMARIWDASSGALLQEFKGHGTKVTSVAFSPDGTRLVTGSFNWTAWVWDAGTGKLLFPLKGHGGSVTSVAYSADGRFLITGSEDKTAKVWDVRTGTLRFDLKGHIGTVQRAGFSPDGTRLVTGSWDGTTKIWDARTGMPLLDLKDQRGGGRSLAFSRDGTRLATGSAEGTVRIWEYAGGGRPIDGKLSAEEQAYRLYWTRPRTE
jgi:WD40 repeat protein